jgi:hypothetical protein
MIQMEFVFLFFVPFKLNWELIIILVSVLLYLTLESKREADTTTVGRNDQNAISKISLALAGLFLTILYLTKLMNDEIYLVILLVIMVVDDTKRVAEIRKYP